MSNTNKFYLLHMILQNISFNYNDNNEVAQHLAFSYTNKSEVAQT
jgi:hypothetical protein